MTLQKKWYLVQIGVGDYVKGSKGPLYKMILDCAQKSRTIGASVFRSFDSVLLKGRPQMVRLFGGRDKSEALLIKVMVSKTNKDAFLANLKELLNGINEPVVVAVSKAEVEVFGFENVKIGNKSNTA